MILQVGVKVVLKNPEGKILLLRRAEGKYSKVVGSWDIPGGRIDPGTTLSENLNRELKEETGLIPASKPLLMAAQDILNFEDRHVVRLTYVARTEGEPTLDGLEHSEYQWVTFEELSKKEDLDVYVKELLVSSLLTKASW